MQENRTVSIIDSVWSGTMTFCDNILFFFKLAFVTLFLFMAGTICLAIITIMPVAILVTIAKIATNNIVTFSSNVVLFASVIIVINCINAMITGALIDMADGQKVTIKNLFNRKGRILKAILVWIIYFIIIILGTVLIVPSLFFGTTYYFAFYEILDKDCSIAEAFKRSAALTKGSRWKILAYAIGRAMTSIVFMLRGVSVLSDVYIYRALEQKQASHSS